jgi:transposase-like protein
MTRGPRRNHSAAFKTKAALAALNGDKILAELAARAGLQADPILE